MNTSVIPVLIHTANHPYPSLKRRGCSIVIPAIKPAPAKAGAGIQSYMLLAVPLIGTYLSLLLSIAPAFAATAPANQNSGVSPAGRDVLKFLGDTAYRSGLTNSPDPNADTTDVYDIVAAIINTVLGLTGIIFFVQVFWAGFRWMTAGGAEETITTAKKTITSSVIGIAIALSAFVITNFVLNKIEEINKGGSDSGASQNNSGATEEPDEDFVLGACEYLVLRTVGYEERVCVQTTMVDCNRRSREASDPGVHEWTPNKPCPEGGDLTPLDVPPGATDLFPGA